VNFFALAVVQVFPGSVDLVSQDPGRVAARLSTVPLHGFHESRAFIERIPVQFVDLSISIHHADGYLGPELYGRIGLASDDGPDPWLMDADDTSCHLMLPFPVHLFLLGIEGFQGAKQHLVPI